MPISKKRIEAGACGKCGKPRMSNGTAALCRSCANKRKLRGQRRRAKRMAASVCVHCGGVKADGTNTLCRACATRHLATVQRHYAHNLAARLKRNLTTRFRPYGYDSKFVLTNLGCTLDELQQWLTRQFVPGMTWTNYGCGANRWSMDHIIALNAIDMRDPLKAAQVCHYTNIQPLWVTQNSAKSDKLNYPSGVLRNMEQPVQVERYGQVVWETSKMDAIRRENCMCHHCANMKPGQPDHCPIAQQFYEICKVNGTAFILTRCMAWKEKPDASPTTATASTAV